MRLWAIPYSTDVERVALALACKGLPAEIVLVDPADRHAVLEVSGWNAPPNAIDAELRRDAPDRDLIARHGAWLTASLDRFEALLHGRPYLAGEALGIADCVEFPFLEYALLPVGADDGDTFHAVLAEHLRLEPRHEGLRRWIRDVDARPRAG